MTAHSGHDYSSDSCGIRQRPVPPDQKESKYASLQSELPAQPGSLLADAQHNVLSATEAWQCGRCRRWICNGCILPFVIRSRGRRMRHKGCGGVFRAPDSPSWIGVRGQRSVPESSWRARFGIQTS